MTSPSSLPLCGIGGSSHYIAGRLGLPHPPVHCSDDPPPPSPLPPAAQMVDVGCGIGGSSRYIAGRLGCSSRGITLSPKQAARANEITAKTAMADRVSFQVCVRVCVCPPRMRWGRGASTDAIAALTARADRVSFQLYVPPAAARRPAATATPATPFPVPALP